MRYVSPARLAVALIVISFTPLVTQATTRTLTPLRDATLFDDPEGAIADGSGQYMFVGRNSSGNVRRTAMYFDLSVIPNIATVSSVSLSMHVSRAVGGSTTVTLQRLLAPWWEGRTDPEAMEGGGAASQEGDVTWRHREYPNIFWTTPGGDFSPVVSASRSVSGFASYTWAGATMLSDVQNWVSGTTPNYGWIIRGNETTDHTAKRFDSRESPDISVRPVLTVTYTIPEPAGMALFVLGLLAMRRR